MSIYLAWSIYKLVGVLVFFALLMFGLWRLAAYQSGGSIYTRRRRKLVKALGVFWLILIGIAAINIGDRQQTLQRSSFNATLEEAPAYVPPPPDILQETRTNFEKSILEIQPKKESNQ
jgi:hypothetical protein